MQGIDRRRVELQERLSTRADDVGTAAARPGRADRGGQFPGGTELAAAGTVDPDEIGIAEPADRSPCSVK